MMNDKFAKSVRKFYQGEMQDHQIYTALADEIKEDDLQRLLRNIAAMELRHADFWKALLEEQGEVIPEVLTPRWRLKWLKLLLHISKPRFVISILELGETAAYECYYEVLRKGQLDAHQKITLSRIIEDELEHESAFQAEKKKSGFNNIRDFILGMNDGLVEILGAVTGLSAAYYGNLLLVAVSGLVVGVAGALSMAIGAFISVRSQRQVNQAQQQRLRILFSVSPERARLEFIHKLEDSGVPTPIAEEVSQRLGDNPEALGRFLLEEVDDNEWRSAWFTGSAYFLGVLFPVLPYFFSETTIGALIGSVFFAGLALAAVGTLVSVISGLSLRTKVTEMLVSGLGAAGLAYLFGRSMQLLFGIEV